MTTNNVEGLYQQIADKLVSVIPDEWNKIFLFAEILNDSRIVYFYFESSSINQLIYSNNIPDTYKVDSNIYSELMNELEELIESLQEEFKKSTPQVWTNLTLYLDNSGEFNIDFDYEGKFKGLAPVRQQTIWKYEVLGIYPTDEYFKGMVDEYLRNKEVQK